MSAERPITRRALAGLLGTAAAGASAVPQSAPTTESNEAEAAMRRNTQALRDLDVPRDTEPAFRFQA